MSDSLSLNIEDVIKEHIVDMLYKEHPKKIVKKFLSEMDDENYFLNEEIIESIDNMIDLVYDKYDDIVNNMLSDKKDVEEETIDDYDE
jgi:hypothetical protein